MAKYIAYNLKSKRNIGTEEAPEWEEYEGARCSMPYSERAEEIAKAECWSGEYTVEEIAETAAEQIVAATAKLRASDGDVLDALDGLLSCTSLTDFLSALVSAGEALRETLDKRRSLREQIAALKDKEG